MPEWNHGLARGISSFRRCESYSGPRIHQVSGGIELGGHSHLWPKVLAGFFKGLVDGKIYRKPWFLPWNIGLSCRFSLKPIQCFLCWVRRHLDMYSIPWPLGCSWLSGCHGSFRTWSAPTWDRLNQTTVALHCHQLNLELEGTCSHTLGYMKIIILSFAWSCFCHLLLSFFVGPVICPCHFSVIFLSWF